jgi:hypothetical protein
MMSFITRVPNRSCDNGAAPPDSAKKYFPPTPVSLFYWDLDIFKNQFAKPLSSLSIRIIYQAYRVPNYFFITIDSMGKVRWYFILS